MYTLIVYIIVKINDWINDVWKLLPSIGILLLIALIINLLIRNHNKTNYDGSSYIDTNKYQVKSINRYVKLLTISIITILLVKVSLPDRDDMLIIVGGGTVLNYIDNNESLKELPNKTTEYIINTLDDNINELDKVINKNKNK